MAASRHTGTAVETLSLMLGTMTCSFHAHGCAADQHARDASLRATSRSNCLECRAVPSASPCELAAQVNVISRAKSTRQGAQRRAALRRRVAARDQAASARARPAIAGEGYL